MKSKAAFPIDQRPSGWELPALTDAEFERFRLLILGAAGIHLRENKRRLLMARLGPRLQQLGLESFSAYYDYQAGEASGRELTVLINRITTNKTSFFREPHHFEFLARHVVPRAREHRLRIWSAACSSGEEPYSIAITLREATGGLAGWDVRILASDIDTEMLARAEAGIYSLESLEGIPGHRLRAHFLRGYGGYEGMAQVRPELRRLLNFRRINLIEPAWPVEERFDVVFCRNAIIYFDRPTQERIVERLAARLHPGGHFFSGHSETLFWARDLLAPVQPTIYRLRAGGEVQ
jgi:chemotaxis protein methyltransferase CheR